MGEKIKGDISFFKFLGKVGGRIFYMEIFAFFIYSILYMYIVCTLEIGPLIFEIEDIIFQLEFEF